MPRPPKKPHWSAALPLPEWAGGPKHVPPPEPPREPVVGLTTGHLMAQVGAPAHEPGDTPETGEQATDEGETKKSSR